MKNKKIRLGIIFGSCVLFIISAITYAIATQEQPAPKSINQIREELLQQGISQNDAIKGSINSAESNNESDSLEILTQNKNFQSHMSECKEYKGDSKINRKSAIEIAVQEAGGDALAAKKITAVKAYYTDEQKIIKDRAVWIVTFHETEVARRGVMIEGKTTSIGDCNVVIDLNTGEWVTSFGYNHLEP